MIQKFGFDFNDAYVSFAGLEFAFRITTFENVYGLDPDLTTLSAGKDSLAMEAHGLRYAGGQRRHAGTVMAEMRQEGRTITFQCSGSHTGDIKGITILIRGLAAAVAADDENIFQWPSTDLNADSFPRIKTPNGRSTILPQSTSANTRRWSVYREYSGHHVVNITEDNRYTDPSRIMEGTVWRLNLKSEIDDPRTAWYDMLELERGLKPWAERTDVPEWFQDVALVLNMHCEGWTGYVFNTFDRQLEILRWMSERIDGKRVLVYLPGWDGRYYWNYPLYEPSEACGGADGLKRLVSGAHELGMHVVPMFGVIASNYIHTRELGLEDTACRTAYGLPEICNWTEWDEDLSPEPIWQSLNVGALKFRRHLLSRITGTTNMFGTDGAMLDISGWAPRDPGHSLLDGLKDLIGSLHERYEDYLIFGENGCDLHMPFIPLFQHGAHLPSDHPFHRYCRSAYHLYCGAPGNGSTGVFESGYNHYVPPKSDIPAIPTLAIVQDTLPSYEQEVEEALETARRWAERWLLYG